MCVCVSVFVCVCVWLVSDPCILARESLVSKALKMQIKEVLYHTCISIRSLFPALAVSFCGHFVHPSAQLRYASMSRSLFLH